MSAELIDELKSYIEQKAHPFALKRAVAPAQEEVAELALWAKSHFSLAAAITPIICLNCHPFLQKVAEALTKHKAACSLLTLDELEKIGFDQLFAHPLFQVLLFPVEQIIAHPFLHAKVASPQVHKLEQKLFGLAKIEEYLHDEAKKRDLWEKLKNMPLSS